jgi:hypothetical protein
MAAILVRTRTDEITDALRALSDAERYLNDTRAHLMQALSDGEPGTLAQARRVAGIVAGCVVTARTFIGEAQRHAA